MKLYNVKTTTYSMQNSKAGASPRRQMQNWQQLVKFISFPILGDGAYDITGCAKTPQNMLPKFQKISSFNLVSLRYPNQETQLNNLTWMHNCILSGMQQHPKLV